MLALILAVELIVAAGLLVVHMVDGRSVTINPDQVMRLSEARRDIDEDKQVAPGIMCIVFFADGSYVSTDEDCIEITNRWLKIREGEDP